MSQCDNCQSPIEPFEIKCHHCGVELDAARALTVPEDMVSEPELSEAFHNWLSQGAHALTQKDYGQACVCFQEALRRAQGLSDNKKELELARRKLASALEKLDKFVEASEQYQILVDTAENDESRANFKGKLDLLVKKAGESQFSLDNNFHQPVNDENKFVALYCPQCKRLLTEAEIYPFRARKIVTTVYLCSHSGEPLVKHDRYYHQALQLAAHERKRAELIAQAAEAPIKNGKKQKQAAVLAFLFGYLGMHKFYLEERAAGYLYLSAFTVFSLVAIFLTAEYETTRHVPLLLVNIAWLLAFMPWIASIFEAIQIFEMSDHSFNLAYNLEKLLAAMPPPEPLPADHMDVFSMAISEEPDELPTL